VEIQSLVYFYHFHFSPIWSYYTATNVSHKQITYILPISWWIILSYRFLLLLYVYIVADWSHLTATTMCPKKISGIDLIRPRNWQILLSSVIVIIFTLLQSDPNQWRSLSVKSRLREQILSFQDFPLCFAVTNPLHIFLL